ncbi:hypothetical protein EVG20_g7242 [Dentipellis fragilis]|uniref:Enoyl reductase (ER) domain-containing protein n=1 Tax=Dentipellis fragilis TaxID=205917 RepID=A0A4Y9YIZ1_9AGAM|nr:hypothetical protein EVG20_g7242 [Dentipellis fragilis]
MSSALPSTQRMVVVQTDQTIALETIPLDKPGPGQVLIKNTAVAQNPSDCTPSLSSGITYVPVTLRVAGKGIELAPSRLRFHFALRATKIAQNAYCEYTLASAAKPLLRTPDNITDEEAATAPLTIFSALQGQETGAVGRAGAPRLASVGQHAIQLARIAGYKVITTASPKHHALVKSLGAAVAIDYHAPDFVEQIIAASGRGGVDFVYDAISEGATIELAARTLRKDGPRKSALVLPPLDMSNLD